jgi:hypothetical protein
LVGCPLVLPKVPEVKDQPVAGLILQTIPWSVLQPDEFTLLPGSAELFMDTGLLTQAVDGNAVKFAMGDFEIRKGSREEIAASHGF